MGQRKSRVKSRGFFCAPMRRGKLFFGVFHSLPVGLVCLALSVVRFRPSQREGGSRLHFGFLGSLACASGLVLLLAFQ